MPPSDFQQSGEQPKRGLFAGISQNIEMAKKGYEQLVHAIIRPPRADGYTLETLGPPEFTFLNQRFRREDVELLTKNTTHPKDPREEPTRLKMQASVWTRVEAGKKKQTPPTASKPNTFVVYLHGNASARVEVLPQLSFLLTQGVFGVCSCDFTGSGKSDGEYVSLGYYERYDLECLLLYLQQTYGPYLEIVLWGRSMGASTALMHASRITQDGIRKSNSNDSSTHSSEDISQHSKPPSKSTTIIKGLICDSPFASLPHLCEELVEKARAQGVVVPGVIISVAMAMIGRSVRKHANFDIREISPIDHTPTIDVPALFVVGADDDFIPPHHSEALIESYQRGVRTNLFMVPGGHNDPRPELVFVAAQQFLRTQLSLTKDTALAINPRMAKSFFCNPPWAYTGHSNIFKAHKSSSASAPVLTEVFGMTKERQDDIQNKVNNLLGQARMN